MTRDSASTLARALVDRIAFAVESLAVAILVCGVLGLAVARFDLQGAAFVWGRFWLRLASPDAAARDLVLVSLGFGFGVVTLLTAFVRWPRARGAFAPFPGAARERSKMLERLR